MNQVNRFFILAVLLSITKFVMAQNVQPQRITLSAPGVINFQHLADQELLNPPAPRAEFNAEADEEQHHGIPKHRDVTGAVITNVVMPTSDLRTQSPAPTTSFNGLLDNGQVIPPDVCGAAGPNHLMETLNSQYRIFNKTGGTVSTLSLSSFWSGVSGSPFSDPHVTYDSSMGKWYAVMLSTLTNNHAGFFLAVSQTDDPTGNWWEYSVDAQGTTGLFMDYPAIGFNNNWIVVTGNMFSGNNFNTTKVFVFNKSSVTSGSAGTVSSFSNNTIFSLEPAVTYDVNVNTEYMLTEWDSNVGGNCHVKIFTITGTQSSPVFTAGNIVGTNQPYNSTTEVDAKQQGTTHQITTNDTRMRTCVYRNGSLYGAQTVWLPATNPTRASSQVWQIDPSTSTVTNFFRIDDNTGTNFYYFPSVSVNSNNDVVVGYTVSSSTTFAGSAYSYRTSADAANTLESSFSYKTGQSSYFKTFGGSINRWGDFSATTVDPGDGSFWTLQEFAYTPANNWGTVWANVAASTAATCATPSGLSSSNITSTDATLSWGNVSGAVSYNVQYRPTGNLTWSSTTSGTTSVSVSGLTASTQYEFQVQTVCSAGSSSFSSSANFTTLSNSGCTETFEPNNTKNTAASISTDVDISSQISASTDIDWYKFNNSIAASNIKVTLTTLPANYNETLYNSSNTQVAISKKTGTQDETMIFNTSIISTYKIKVNGAGGAFSNTQCYTLHVYTSNTPFKLGDVPPVALSDNTLKIYPNPNAGIMTMEYTSGNDATIQLRIFDLAGKILLQEQQQISEGVNALHPDLGKLVCGVYFVQISNGSEISRSKFMIEK